MVTQSAEAGTSMDALITEVKCYKLAQNRSFDECLQGVVAAVMSMAAPTGSAAKTIGVIKSEVLRVKPLLTTLIQSQLHEVSVPTCVLNARLLKNKEITQLGLRGTGSDYQYF